MRNHIFSLKDRIYNKFFNNLFIIEFFLWRNDWKNSVTYVVEGLVYSWNFLVPESMMRDTLASQRTLNS